MQLLNIALVVLCCCAGVAHGQAKGVACPAGTCDADLVCQEGTCRVKIGGACAADSTDECVVTAADCPSAGNTLECGCPADTDANDDDTECVCTDPKKVLKADKTCGLKAGETDCSNSDANCLDDGTCNTDTCECSGNFVASSDSTKCLLKAGQTGCGGDNGKCLDDGTCNTDTCACTGNFVANSDNDKCLKKAEQSCNTEADCLTGATCEGDPKTCTCPYGANDDNTKCRVKIGEACTASSTDECVVTAADCPASGSLQCACPADTTANTEKTECVCDDNKKTVKADKTCGLKAGETGCSGNGDCLDDATCSSETCECSTNYVANTDKTKCLKKADQPCDDASECLTGATCEGDPKKCTCPNGANDEKTKCSGASAVMASLTLLLAALVASLRM